MISVAVYWWYLFNAGNKDEQLLGKWGRVYTLLHATVWMNVLSCGCQGAQPPGATADPGQCKTDWYWSGGTWSRGVHWRQIFWWRWVNTVFSPFQSFPNSHLACSKNFLIIALPYSLGILIGAYDQTHVYRYNQKSCPEWMKLSY